MDRFTRIGFEIEEFGQDSYAVRAVPDNLFSIAKKELLIQMLDSLSDEIARNQSPDLIDEKIASMSCKAAVKGNMKLSVQEVDALIGELLSLDNPYHCPHGRPTIIAMTKRELKRNSRGSYKMKKKPLVVTFNSGPTAVGKTKASIGLAKAIGGEIISADSMQVYEYMNIGSAKIRPEEMQGVPHYLIDDLKPWDEFHVVRFQQMAKKCNGTDLCQRTYSNRCRRNRILYPGITVRY